MSSGGVGAGWRSWPSSAGGAGCPAIPDRPDESVDDPHHDWDGDGFCEEEPCVGGGEPGDCDDGAATIFPGADEVCDGLDSDCDGELPAEELDGDQDGFLGCAECDDHDADLQHDDADGDGHSTCDGDCDDGDPAVHPEAAETCNGLDDDCDGLIPDDERDDDGDGFEECGIDGAEADCDDGDAAVHPGAVESCNGLDDDCDPSTDEEADSDGDGASLCDGDCDDGDERVGADTVETCDGLDNDCDGESDEECVDCGRWVPDDHAAVQEALDSAADGETICVAPGIHAGPLTWGGFEGRLLGVAGPGPTVLDGGGMATTVTFSDGEGPEATLAGFSVVGGSGDNGGGIAVVDSSPTLQRLIVLGNEAAFNGGGISLSGSTSSLVDLRIEDNIADGDGGGLHVDGASVVTIGHARLARNQAEKGGGIRLTDGSEAVIANAVVDGNDASSKGGGIYVYDAIATLERVRITGNAAGEDGGGLRVRSNALATITNAIVAGNAATGDGGGVHLVGFAEVVMGNVAVVGNEAGTSGGGIYVNTSSTAAYGNTDISANAAAAGGGVFTEGGATLAATRSNAVANTPNQYDGAVGDPTGTFGNVMHAPGYLDTGAPEPADWDLHLAADSDLVDIGSTDLTDPDGTRSDIGAYGGEGAGAWDLDNDGYPEWWQPGEYDPTTYPAEDWDCDDTDPAVHADQGC